MPEPLHLLYPESALAARTEATKSGSFREKVRYDLIPRPYYAFGLLAAADVARFCGIEKLIAIECGVAEGAGLLNLCELAERVTRETNVAFEIVGFDTGEGLPALEDYRDHPEIWTQGDFSTSDRARLEARLPAHARMIWGNVKETIRPFLQNVSASAPIGFVSMDLDIYSSTRDAMALFLGEPEQYLPVTLTYFDDTHGSPERIGSLFRNRWCGQLRAIDEFNEQHAARKIDIIRTLPHRRSLHHEIWMEQVYGVHILDHPRRQPGTGRAPLRIADYAAFSRMEWPL